MRYAALIGEQERQVDIIEPAPGQYQITMDGRTLQVDANAISDSTLSLIHDNHTYNIESEKSPNGGETVLVRGHLITVEVLDLRSLQLRKVQAITGDADGPATIRSPMPGKVVAVLVKPGQQVSKGDGVVVVEAMKMENELKSPRDGTVGELKVELGATVDGGAVLCVIQ